MGLEIIAEFATNHTDPEGNISPSLREMMKLLKLKGADYIKFQYFKTSNLVKENTEAWDIIKKLELPIDAHIKFKKMCEEEGVKYLCTPLFPEGLNELLDIGLKEIKVASMDCGNLQMMNDLLDNKERIERIILSTGISTIEEIDLSMAVLLKGNFKIDLLHCVSSYPTSPYNASLGLVNLLKKKYGHVARIGYSDHTLDSQTAVIARVLGCEVFEKHVTLDNDQPGLEHPHSLLISQFGKYVKAIKNVDLMIEEKLEYENRNTMKRGIWFNRNLKKGHKISREDIILRRPLLGTVGTTSYLTILNKKLKRAVQKDSPVILEDLYE